MVNVQESVLRPFLGDDIYDNIEEDTYITPENETLLETYIKPWLIFATWAEMMKSPNIFHTNSGLKQFVSDYGQQPDPKLIEMQARDAAADAERYFDLMRIYLRENETLFPTWPGHESCTPKRENLPFNFGKIAKPKPSDQSFGIPL